MKKKEIKYISPPELSKLLASEIPPRLASAIRLSVTYGLRLQELCSLKKSNVNLTQQTIHIQRVKNSASRTYPLNLSLKDSPGNFSLKIFKKDLDHLEKFSYSGLHGMLKRYTLKTLGREYTFKCLRHACGYILVNSGVDIRKVQEWLGHKNIANTVIYTSLSPRSFAGIGKAFENLDLSQAI